MKQQTAKLNHLRMAPRKVRLVAHLIKGMSANNAQAQLMVNPKRASEPVLKLLQSAIANAKNKEMAIEKLFVKEIRVDGGPMLKRWLPRAQGRATPIQKKSSHITIILEEKDSTKASKFTITKQVKLKKSEAAKIVKEEAKAEKKKSKASENEKSKEKEAKKKEKAFAPKVFSRKSI